MSPTFWTQPFRVAVLTTRRAPGLDRLLEHEARDRDWTISLVAVTDPASAALEVAAARNEVRRVGGRIVVGDRVGPRELEAPAATERLSVVQGRRIGAGG